MLTEEQLKEEEMRYPMKRYGTLEDITNLMLSDASTWMSGTNVRVIGGN